VGKHKLFYLLAYLLCCDDFKCSQVSLYIIVVVVNVMLVLYTWSDWPTTIFGSADKAESAAHTAMCSWLVGAMSLS